MPPVPPQVSYRNGLLSIVASNSTLADVLHAVSVRTGATVDAPANLMNERVAVRLGPGSPRDVLSDLLSGPRFDYILVGDANNPDSVRTIMLTANTSAAPSAARPSVPVAQTQPGPRQPNIPQEEVMDEEVGGAEEQVEPEQPPQQPPVQAVRPPQQPAPVVPQQFPQPGANAGENPNAQQPQVKTPEQLLEELRKLQQQQGTGQPPPQR